MLATENEDLMLEHDSAMTKYNALTTWVMLLEAQLI
jgi:hypothetical protein